MSRRRNSLPLHWILTAALVALATGCSRRPVYSHFESVGPDGWDKADTLRFTVPPVHAPHDALHLQFGLRASSLYPYTQLTVVVAQQARPSGAARTDTLCFSITDGDGNILGRGLSIYQYTQTLPTPPVAPEDTLCLTVSHAMRRQLLPGIVDAGVTVRTY